MLGIPLGAFIAFAAGMVSVIGFVSAVELSSNEGMCLSCHEMKDNVYAEYQETSHYNNRTGVRATCADCHEPHPWGPKIVRKIRATLVEVPQHILGELDTAEKFEAHRARMAQDVWDEMKQNDSRECRSCHSQEHMDLAAQDKSARKKHALEVWREQGKTCIDCHKGIAHHLPDVALDSTVPDSD
ncbi:cytochrome c-type protein NapC [Sinimarinibacterium sp. CAU 1509]|uniref:NapC/NirT family cytochrome c n=1 Tax=Sinimarinibacterium sp. CAU 1509 TaxID=2562283 RepID=UPI0010ACBDDB|nr:NapC/NirT family cytochrome c [Sinimarinibacterium sp. CAU 1509]TJY58926.1 cytochrome c-type protein NapC [Sinimarinibacterium sp. CAU 1509]